MSLFKHSAGFVFLWLCNSVYAQAPLRFDHLDVTNGLANNSVTAIIKDHKGFMWFGTRGGLNKYDGYKITQYRVEIGKTEKIPSNNILSIYEDPSGIIWLGSDDAGLIKFDPSTGVFTPHKKLQQSDDLSFSMVRDIFEDRNNILWLATDAGLIKFSKEKNYFQKFVPQLDDHRLHDLTCIDEDVSGKLWIGTLGGMIAFDPATEKFSVNKQAEFGLAKSVLSIYIDVANVLWAGTDGGGLTKFNTINEQFVSFTSETSSLNSNIIYDIKQFKGGKLWIATASGINIMDVKTETFQRIVGHQNDPASLRDNDIRCLYKDNHEILWVGTNDGGVAKADLSKGKFKHYKRDADAPAHSLSANNVFAIEEDHFGNIWIGTVDGGLNRFNPKTKMFLPFMPDAKNKNSISSAKILSLDIGPSRNLWIGTDLDGLCMLPASQLNEAVGNVTFLKFYENATKNALSSNVIYSVLEDQQQVVWAGTWSKGLNKMVFDKSGGKPNYQTPDITHYTFDRRKPISISHDIIFKMYEDSDGTLWIGTAGGGLDKKVLSPRGADAFVHFKSDAADSSSLSDNFVSAIYESKDGNFWIGTTTGLNKMNRKTGSFKSYTVKDGLASNVIFGILEDNHGNLWLGTHAGISKFDPAHETFRNYTVEDGVQGDVFNPDAYCLSRTGEMYFGGTNGMTVFFPDSVKDNPYRPEVILTDLKVLDEKGRRTHHDESFEYSIPYAREINLRYDDRMFSIEFASSHHAIPNKNKFAYRLDGFNTDWITADAGSRTATFTNLDPGKYVFRAKAANADGVWGDKEFSLVVNIAPPFWKTSFFKIVSVVSGCGLLFLIYYVRIRTVENQRHILEKLVALRTNEILAQKEEIETQKESIEEKNILLENQQLHLEKLVDERTCELLKMNMELQDKNQRFEQYGFMTSHNFRGPVASLLGLCKIFNRQNLSDPENKMIVERMEETTLRIDEMIRDLSTLLDKETNIETLFELVDLGEIIKSVVRLLTNEIKESDAQITFDFSEQPYVHAIPAYMNSVTYNLISNALKFRKENEPPKIEIKSTRIEDRVYVTFKDSGIGIDLNRFADAIFRPFKRFQPNVLGKGLGLYLVKTQMKAMSGHVEVESQIGKGTVFKLIFKE